MLSLQKEIKLIELLIVIAIIAPFLSIIIPALGKAKVYAEEIVCKAVCVNTASAPATNGTNLIEFYTTGRWKFYDLKNNPLEMHNEYSNPDFRLS